MHRAFNLVIENAIWVVLVGFTLCVTLAFVITLVPTPGESKVSFGHGLETSLSILMTLESPKSLLATEGSGIRVLGWLVAFFGWLTIPALLGVLISHTAVDALREKEYRFIARSIAKDLGLDKERAERLAQAIAGSRRDFFANDSESEVKKVIHANPPEAAIQPGRDRSPEKEIQYRQTDRPGSN